jgi:hypothetical protein
MVKHLLISNSVMKTVSMHEAGAGPCIGTGCAIRGGASVVDDVTIWNSSLATSDCLSGSRIGSGNARNGNSSIGSLVIASSTVNDSVAWGDCGIGAGGVCDGGVSLFADLWICNSTVLAGSKSRCVIGSGVAGGEVGALFFCGSCLIECQGNGTSALVNASSLSLSNGSLTFVTDESGGSRESFDLVLDCGDHGSRASSLMGLFLEINNPGESGAEEDLRSIRFYAATRDFRRCFSDKRALVRAIIVTDGWDSLIGFVDVPVGSGTRDANGSFHAYIHPSSESFVGYMGPETSLPIRMADSFIDVVEISFGADMVQMGLFDSGSDGLSLSFPPDVDDSSIIGINISGDRIENSAVNDSGRKWRNGRPIEPPDVVEDLGCNRTVCQESYDYFKQSQKNIIAFLDQLPSKEPLRLWREGSFSDLDFSEVFNEIELSQFNPLYRSYASSAGSALSHCTALCQDRHMVNRSI